VTSTDNKAPHYVVLSTPPVTLSLLGPNVLLSILFSNTLNLCTSINVTDQVPHSYKHNSQNYSPLYHNLYILG